jgi:WD40-like Beta Propeller Repeat
MCTTLCTRSTRAVVTLAGTALLTLALVPGVPQEALAQSVHHDVLTQTGYIPYYGKNKIRYNNFKWHIYTTDHFEVYYYPEIEQHLERVVSYAESAYQLVSSDLKHDLAFKIPLMLYKTQSEFQQQNVEPTELPEGVLAFAEPYRDRMVLPIDEPDDALYRLITHELTHIFEFDIIPRSLLRRGLPLWVDEGLADYMTSYWNSFDLMTVRDAAIADTVPAMSDFQGAAFVDGRLPYNLGHAAFEFIESRWGKEGIRQFLFALRKNVIGGGESAYEEAFRLRAEEFDEQFEKYLKDRFKPFRDKERPTDYGRDLAPKREKTPYVTVVSIEPSPSGDLLAVAAGNRKDQELDIILLSTKDNKVMHNLTGGFNKDRGYEYIATPGGFRNNAVPWISWAPAGDRIAYFARTEKMKTLILQNVVNGKIDHRIELKTVDMPESPDISPDGKEVAFSGLSGATGDIFVVNLESRDVRNVTKDDFGDYAPTWSPDGKSLVYLARVSGNDKLFRVDLASGQKTQLTFGTHDDGGAQFVDDDTLVFPSTAIDPNQPIEAEVARNGNIYNIWTLNLKTKELRQFTDTLTANTSPVVLRDSKPARIGFVTYYKGEYGIHVLTREEPLHTVASNDFGDASAGPPIPFQPPMGHTIVAANKRKKGAFEKLFLEGRPPVAVGVTSGGDLFGGTQVTFTDVLGDKQFNVFVASVSQYRTMSFSYINLSRRLQYAVQAYSQTQFYYGYDPYYLYPIEYGYIDRDLAQATQTARGGSISAIYPLNRYTRLAMTGGFLQYKQEYNEQRLQEIADEFQLENYGRVLFSDGQFAPVGVSLTRETTIFREYGPLAGHTMYVGYEYAPSWGDMLSRQAVDLDARYYLRLGTNGVLALRARGYKSWGEYPGYIYFGGNSEMRGYDYLSFLGNKGFFGNAELRFPIIEAALTPIGVVGGLRGVFFFNLGSASYDSVDVNVWRSDTTVETPLVDYVFDPTSPSQFTPVYGTPRPVSGFRLVDSRASYGLGLETFALGFPIHFDWSWRTLFNRDYEDVLFSYPALVDGIQGPNAGSTWFRRVKFSVWIGYDF